MASTDGQNWDWEIKPTGVKSLRLDDIFRHSDLLFAFLRRELLAGYKQTVVGWLWIILQPALATIFYLIVFNRIIGINTGHVAPVLFYMSGAILWGFFAEVVSGTMYTFLYNTHIFSKVYFPRLIIPLSTLLNHSLRLAVQLGIFIAVWLIFAGNQAIGHIVWLAPLALLQVAAFAMGCGLLLSVALARFRDVEYIMGFVLRLWMFITPVVYPASLIPPHYRFLAWLNPLTTSVEFFRNAMFGGPLPDARYIAISFAATLVILLTGLAVFKKHEISIMDTI